MNPALQTRILACPDLPALPDVALEVLGLCRSDDTDAAGIAAALARDPALAAKILRAANAAALGARTPVTTLQRAVALLGTHATLALAVGFSVVRGRGAGRGFDHAAFWRRSILAGIASEALGRGTALEPEELYLAGLLQDLGILALHAVLGDVHAALRRAAGEDHDALVRSERAVLGADHGEVTWLLLRHWGLPEPFLQSALFSHDLDAAQGYAPGLRAALAGVYLSGRVADAWRGAIPPEVLEAARARVGVPPAALAAAVRELQAALPQAASELEVDLGDPAAGEPLLAAFGAGGRGRQPRA